MSKIAFLYPGQGAQKCGMGKDFYENVVASRQVIDMAQEKLDFDLKQMCFEDNEKIHETKYTQPTMVAVCLAITKALIDKGFTPDVTAGLSLGEYAAIAVSGALTYEDAVWMVSQRGKFMQEAALQYPGAMAAVLAMPEQSIENIVGEIDGVSVANYNCPGQTVITGENNAVSKASQILLEQGAKRVIPLQVSGAFHSPYMQPAADKLKKILDVTTFKPLVLPYVCNVSAEYVTNSDMIADLLYRQVTSSVRFSQSVRNMIEAGIDTFVEIGPGKTLSGFIRKIDRDVTVLHVETLEDMNQIC